MNIKRWKQFENKELDFKVNEMFEDIMDHVDTLEGKLNTYEIDQLTDEQGRELQGRIDSLGNLVNKAL